MSSFSESLNAVMDKLESVVKTETVVGKPITVGDVIIVPFIEINIGTGGGGGSGDKKDGLSGVGMGARMSPVAAVVVIKDTVQLINIKNTDSMSKLIDLVPGVVSKVSGFMDKSNDSKTEQTT